MNKIEYALESFKNIQDLIKFADQKAGAILVITGLVFTIFVQYLEILFFSTDSITLVGLLTFFAGISTVVSMVTVLYLTIFKILKPRYAQDYQEDELSTYYFEHINYVGKGLHKKFEVINEEEMLKDIIDQQIEVSKILMKKNKYLVKSFFWLFISVLTTIVHIILTIQI